MTLSALIKNAILTLINADWTPTALIGQSAARIPLVPMGREIVIITPIVRDHYFVAMTIVRMDQLEWTAVKRTLVKKMLLLGDDIHMTSAMRKGEMWPILQKN